MTDQPKELLPVTEADRELAERICWSRSEKEIAEVANLIARHRIESTRPSATSGEEPWPGCYADLQRRRVVTLATLGLMLSKMAGGEAAEVVGYDAADLYAEVLMALAIEDADDTDIALEEARDHPEDDMLARLTAPSGEGRSNGAGEERDALLAALGWKTGPFISEMSRKVILDDTAGLRPEMVKARRRAEEAEADRDFWRWIAGEVVEGTRSGLLLRVWTALKAERSQRKRLSALSPQASTAGEVEKLREAVLACVDAMRAWIIPDGITADEAMQRIVGALDNPEINPIILESDHGRS